MYCDYYAPGSPLYICLWWGKMTYIWIIRPQETFSGPVREADTQCRDSLCGAEWSGQIGLLANFSGEKVNVFYAYEEEWGWIFGDWKGHNRECLMIYQLYFPFLLAYSWTTSSNLPSVKWFYDQILANTACIKSVVYSSKAHKTLLNYSDSHFSCLTGWMAKSYSEDGSHICVWWCQNLEQTEFTDDNME